MGVIKRQGLKNSVVLYLGTILGMVNVLFIYPAFFTPEELGLTRFLVDTALLFAPIILIGAKNLIVRFYPEFKNPENGHNGYLSLLLVYSLFSAGIFTVVYLIFRDPISEYYANRSPLFRDYFYVLWVLILLASFAGLFRSYAINFMRITIPTLIDQWLIKIALPMLAVFYYFQFIDLDWVVYGIVITFTLSFVFQVIYLRYLKELKFTSFQKKISKTLVKRMGVFALFGFFGALGHKAISFLDAFMVGTLSSLENLAVFSIAFFICNVMSIPMYSLQSISSPIVANAWIKNDVNQILDLYRKSTSLLLIAGFGLFLIIWSQIDHLYTIMPNGDFYSAGKTVVLILGISKLLDLSTGVNTIILSYSKHFRYGFYSMFILAIGSVFLNLYFIPLYGINGAALATLISLGLFNLFRLWFIWYKFGMQPYTLKSLWLVITGIGFLIAGHFLPGSGILLLDIAWQVTLLGGSFAGIVYYFRWSEDFNTTVEQVLRKIGDILRTIGER